MSLFKSLRAGSHVFALLMLFHCVIWHMHMHLDLWYVVLVCHSMMFVKIMLSVCMLGVMVV